MSRTSNIPENNLALTGFRARRALSLPPLQQMMINFKVADQVRSETIHVSARYSIPSSPRLFGTGDPVFPSSSVISLAGARMFPSLTIKRLVNSYSAIEKPLPELVADEGTRHPTHGRYLPRDLRDQHPPNIFLPFEERIRAFLAFSPFPGLFPVSVTTLLPPSTTWVWTSSLFPIPFFRTPTLSLSVSFSGLALQKCPPLLTLLKKDHHPVFHLIF